MIVNKVSFTNAKIAVLIFNDCLRQCYQIFFSLLRPGCNNPCKYNLALFRVACPARDPSRAQPKKEGNAIAKQCVPSFFHTRK